MNSMIVYILAVKYRFVRSFYQYHVKCVNERENISNSISTICILWPYIFYRFQYTQQNFPHVPKFVKKKERKFTIINIRWRKNPSKTDIKHRTVDREKQGKNRGKLSTPALSGSYRRRTVDLKLEAFESKNRSLKLMLLAKGVLFRGTKRGTRERLMEVPDTIHYRYSANSNDSE